MYYHPLARPGADVHNEIAGSNERANPIRKTVVGPEHRRLAPVRKVLIPIDGSERAFEAIAHLLRSVRRAPAVEVHLVNVQPLVMPGDFALDIAVPAERGARLVAGQEALDRARAVLDAAAIPCQTAVIFGDPAQAIARYAREHDCDAIVMGTRGVSPLRSMLGRSVAAKVVGLTDVPVTLVKSAGRLAALLQEPTARRPADSGSRTAYVANA